MDIIVLLSWRESLDNNQVARLKKIDKLIASSERDKIIDMTGMISDEDFFTQCLDYIRIATGLDIYYKKNELIIYQ